MKKLPLFTALALSLIPLACAVSGHQKVPLPDQNVEVTRADVARIYFVREGTTGLFKADIAVFDGDTDIGSLDPSSYLCWERPGGRTLGRAFYMAVIDGSKGKLEGIADLDCQAGKTYYFNVTIDRAYGQPKVALLDPAQGRKLVAERKPAAKP